MNNRVLEFTPDEIKMVIRALKGAIPASNAPEENLRTAMLAVMEDTRDKYRINYQSARVYEFTVRGDSEEDAILSACSIVECECRDTSPHFVKEEDDEESMTGFTVTKLTP